MRQTRRNLPIRRLRQKDEAKAYEYYLLAFTKKEHEASEKYVKNKDNAAKACKANIALGCEYAGSAYYQEKRFAKAAEYFDKGCDLGSAQSCSTLENIK